ncbi:prepilin-type N-terminal cleavage/methylation domain-containing protein [Clostridium butyricum]|uniref:prepilin-type N-terminal cleavage/methylation domain-containing protein n=1 Tax=Clostridium butyricum TaxID=1492 RepID=UPI00374EBDF3
MNQLVLKKKNELMKKKKGFTLVELIIVIAIIAVLAAVAIPKFTATKNSANRAADEANAKIIATAVASALTDDVTLSTGDLSADDKTAIQKYIDGGSLPKCKTGTWAISNTANGTIVTNGTTQMYPPVED